MNTTAMTMAAANATRGLYNKKLAQEIASSTGFRLDENTGILHGQRGIFPVIMAVSAADNNCYAMHFSVSRAGQAPDAGTIKEIRKAHKSCIARCDVQGYHVRFVIPVCMTKKKTLEKVTEALNAVPDALAREGYQPCCEGCGQPVETQSYNVRGIPAQMCAPCFTNVSNQIAQAQYLEASKKENIIGGTVGALLGALIGGVAIVILARLGYVAWISGVIMGVCALGGYKMLGGKLTAKSVLICIVIMAAVVYLANRVGLSMELQAAVRREFGSRAKDSFGFFDAFKMLPGLAKEESDIRRIYYGNLGLTYLFTALGAAPTVIQTLKNRSAETTAARI